jgi:Zn-dependent protease with chaperone function
MNGESADSVHTAGPPYRFAMGLTTALPPWIWLFLALATWNETVRTPQIMRMILEYSFDSPHIIVDIASDFTQFFLLIPSILPLIALFTILTSSRRGKRQERRFGLRPITSDDRVLSEIAAFVRSHSPGVRVTANPLRTDHVAFVYPSGYRNASIGVFGGLLRIWRADRSAAEAILVHELSHHTSKDWLLAGVGSQFSEIVKYFLPLSIVVVWMSFSLEIVVRHLLHGANPEYQMDFATTLVYWSRNALDFVIVAITNAKQVFHKLLPYIVAFWCLELYCDTLAARSLGKSAMLNALRLVAERPTWWRWILNRFIHPPLSLRRRLAAWSDSPLGFVLALLLFPIGVWLDLLILYLSLLANSAYALFRMTGTQTYRDEAYRLVIFAMSRMQQEFWSYCVVFLVCGVVLVIWPFLRLILARPRSDSNNLAIGGHWTLFVFAGLVCVVGGVSATWVTGYVCYNLLMVLVAEPFQNM